MRSALRWSSRVLRWFQGNQLLPDILAKVAAPAVGAWPDREKRWDVPAETRDKAPAAGALF